MLRPNINNRLISDPGPGEENERGKTLQLRQWGQEHQGGGVHQHPGPGRDDASVLRLPLPGPGPDEPAGRRVHQWSASSKSHPTEDSGDGRGGREALCDQQTAEGQSRLRVKDP